MSEFLMTRTGKVEAGKGSAQPARADIEGLLLMAEAHGRFTEAARRGEVHFACNQAGVAATAGLSATSANLALVNPPGSGKQIELLDVIVIPTLDAAADATVLLGGNIAAPPYARPTATTAEQIRNALLGRKISTVAEAYKTATLAAAPEAIRPLMGFPWATAAGFQSVMGLDRLDGMMILDEGTCVAIEALAAITLLCAMFWRDIDKQ